MINAAAVKLRAQLADPGTVVVCPGVQDGLSARVCLQQGFENLYMVCESCISLSLYAMYVAIPLTLSHLNRRRHGYEPPWHARSWTHHGR